MPQDYFLLKDYMERLNDIQDSYSAITLYPEINNKKFSKLEEGNDILSTLKCGVS